MMAIDLKPGDKVIRSIDGIPFLLHYGNYAGRDYLGTHWVFEHGKGGICRLTKWIDFSKGYKVSTIKIPDNERSHAINRMRSLLSNPKDYDLLNFNCQHASNYIASGKVISEQIGITLAISTIGFLALISKK